mgnify:CR=1 FL=1
MVMALELLMSPVNVPVSIHVAPGVALRNSTVCLM